MAEYSIRIGGASGFTISKSTVYGKKTKIVPLMEQMISNSGQQEGTLLSIEVEGLIIDSTGTLVSTGFSAILDRVRDQTGAVKVELLRDGGEWETFEPATSHWGPFVTKVALIEDEEGGELESHARYALTIRAALKAAAGSGDTTVYGLKTSIEEQRNKKGDLVRKIWRASAKAKNVTTALDLVESFKPGEEGITEVIVRRFEEAEAEAVWVWEYQRAGSIKSWRCVVTIVAGGSDYAVDPQVDGFPNVHEVLDDAAIIEVKGRIVGSDPSVLVAPAPHYTAGSGLVRARRRETENMAGPAIENEEEGTYYITYHEVYLAYGEFTYDPLHSGEHHLITSEEPGDGGIAA